MFEIRFRTIGCLLQQTMPWSFKSRNSAVSNVIIFKEFTVTRGCVNLTPETYLVQLVKKKSNDFLCTQIAKQSCQNCGFLLSNTIQWPRASLQIHSSLFNLVFVSVSVIITRPRKTIQKQTKRQNQNPTWRDAALTRRGRWRGGFFEALQGQEVPLLALLRNGHKLKPLRFNFFILPFISSHAVSRPRIITAKTYRAFKEEMLVCSFFLFFFFQSMIQHTAAADPAPLPPLSRRRARLSGSLSVGNNLSPPDGGMTSQTLFFCLVNLTAPSEKIQLILPLQRICDCRSVDEMRSSAVWRSEVVVAAAAGSLTHWLCFNYSRSPSHYLTRTVEDSSRTLAKKVREKRREPRLQVGEEADEHVVFLLITGEVMDDFLHQSRRWH